MAVPTLPPDLRRSPPPPSGAAKERLPAARGVRSTANPHSSAPDRATRTRVEGSVARHHAAIAANRHSTPRVAAASWPMLPASRQRSPRRHKSRTASRRSCHSEILQAASAALARSTHSCHARPSAASGPTQASRPTPPSLSSKTGPEFTRPPRRRPPSRPRGAPAHGSAAASGPGCRRRRPRPRYRAGRAARCRARASYPGPGRCGPAA